MAGGQWIMQSADGVPPVGAPVEVRQRYTDRWAAGFEVARIDLAGVEPVIELRRQSDGAILPATFPLSDVRRR